jgi:hypothetical protein
MDVLELLEDLGNVPPAEDATIEATVELVLTAAYKEHGSGAPNAHGRAWVPRRRWLFGGAAVATAAAVAAVVVVFVPATKAGHDLVRNGSAPTTLAPKTSGPAVLTAAMIRHITSASTTALAASGTATVTMTTTTGSGPPEVDHTAVTFSGANLNYVITTSDNPKGVAINRVVDGKLYLYVIGQDLQYHWYRDTSSDAGSSLAFPDPRTLVGELTPEAGFVDAGSQQVDGTELTELEATNLRDLNTAALKNFGGGPLSGFSVWVDGNDVVQKIVMTSTNSAESIRPAPSGATAACPAGFTLHAPKQPSDAQSARGAVAGHELCAEAVTMTTTTEIDFANIGAPETITAPAGAIDQEMHG